jgi:hypothetical protein
MERLTDVSAFPPESRFYRVKRIAFLRDRRAAVQRLGFPRTATGTRSSGRSGSPRSGLPFSRDETKLPLPPSRGPARVVAGHARPLCRPRFAGEALRPRHALGPVGGGRERRGDGRGAGTSRLVPAPRPGDDTASTRKSGGASRPAASQVPVGTTSAQRTRRRRSSASSPMLPSRAAAGSGTAVTVRKRSPVPPFRPAVASS